MVNGINYNDELNSTQLDKQLGVSGVATNPIKNPYNNADKGLLIDESAISNEAINLYQKEQDVGKFNNLALSDPQDLSHEQIISDLFQKGISDPFSDEALQQLSSNEKLLSDLSVEF